MMNVDKMTAQFLQRALKQGASLKVRIQGSCMAPLIEPDSLVIVEGLDALRVGCVVLFQDPTGQYLAHRVVDINTDSVITCGDRNILVDNPVPFSWLIGIIRAVPEKDQATYTLPKIVAFVSPKINILSINQTILNGVSVAKVSDILTVLKNIQSENYYTVLLHKAAQHDFRSIPCQASKIAVFMGFQAAKHSMNDPLGIGVNDVDLVARTKRGWWQRSTIDEDLTYLKGFQDGRVMNNGLGNN